MLNPEDVDGRHELQQKFDHLRRIAIKESAPRMRLFNQLHAFPSIYEEFKATYSRRQLESLEKCFLMADHDRDGRLNSIELKYWLEKHNRPVSHRELGKILEIADEDGDGALNFKEFLHFCHKIELKDTSSSTSEGEETFYDCLTGDDNQSHPHHSHHHHHHHKHHKSHSKSRKSVEDLHQVPLVLENVKYFEARLSETNGKGKPTLEESRAAEYEKRVQEIKKESGFDFHEFFKDIHHPPIEEIKKCPSPTEARHSRHSHFSKTTEKRTSHDHRRYRTSLHIQPNPEAHKILHDDQNQNHQHHHPRKSSKKESEDDAIVILPVTPGSSHKFEPEQLTVTAPELQVVHGQDWSAVSVREEDRRGTNIIEEANGTETETITESNNDESVAEAFIDEIGTEVTELSEEEQRRQRKSLEAYERSYGSIMPEDFENLEIATPTPASALWNLLRFK